MSLQETAKRLLPIVQAMAEGKTVQTRSLLNGKWIEDVDWEYHTCAAREHRIKPERKLRPYTREELFGIVSKVVRRIDVHDERLMILGVTEGVEVMVAAIGLIKASRLAEAYMFVEDCECGSPCGVWEEE